MWIIVAGIRVGTGIRAAVSNPPPVIRVSAFAAAVALAAALVTPVAAAGAHDDAMACTGAGRIRTCAVDVPKGVHVRNATVRVVLPVGYDGSKADYPVVFVLHGVGDNESSWTNPSRGNLAALTTRCDAIFVTPDGGSGRDAGWYSDWADGSYQWETFHTKVLPKAVDATFRTQGPRHRAIAGLSMGGFGALSYAGRHPGMFKAAASYSGFADTRFGAPVSGLGYELTGQNDVYSTGAPSSRVWGDQTAAAAVWAAHNPYDLVPALRATALYISSGTGTPGGAQGDDPSKLPNYALEAYISQLNNRLASRLQEQHVPFTDGRYSGGDHDWPYWRAALADSLKVLMPAVGARSC
jgi:S-formylglutathione hydrolase FrmB